MTGSGRPDAGGDICPQCGTEVAAPVPGGTGGTQTSHPVETACLKCGQRLRRAVGGAWHLTDEADLAGDGPSDRDSALDEALEESFPASDPPAL
jgi:hypothetical protein